jgi:hypothetical protein
MLLLKDVIESVMIESGQYILESIEDTLLSNARFLKLCNREVKLFSKYRPVEGTCRGFLRNHMKFDGLQHAIPRNISGIYYDGNALSGVDLHLELGYHTARRPMPHLSYSYSADGVLHLAIPDGYYHYDYIADHAFDEKQCGWPTIDNSYCDQIQDMISGRFMMSVGRSRRAFTVQELTLTTDADTLTSEGMTLYDQASEELKINRSSWWLAVAP